ncbi:MAG: hypothetical protein IJU98_10780 [Synergistaceae bacterium]|nr:hypothetical protein [Synergistaceae bacterium]
MPGVYSRNKLCDTDFWIGEISMDEFEETVFIDDIMEVPVFEAYEEAIENFWPHFIEESVL